MAPIHPEIAMENNNAYRSGDRSTDKTSTTPDKHSPTATTCIQKIFRRTTRPSFA